MTSPTLDPQLMQLIKEVMLQFHHYLPPSPTEIDFNAIAFYWQNRQLHPIRSPASIHLDDLKGIETQKQKLIQNTQQFLHGLPANDVLLTGARGCGKSSLVRALLTDYHHQGLRLIEIARDNLKDLPEIRHLICHRPEKFIIYCDDLAFNAEDENYRSLKSALDGSLQSGRHTAFGPSAHDNILIYATSNRRHLLPEFMQDNLPRQVDVPQYQDLHPQEAIEEKISLSDRFGLWLSFYAVDQTLYLDIVRHWLAQAGQPFDEVARFEALKWSQSRGQRSGRSAYQFARHWIGKYQLERLQSTVKEMR